MRIVRHEERRKRSARCHSFHVTVEGLRKLVYTPHIYVVNLNIDGQVYNAIMKDIQFHPVTDAILHVDFYQINEENRL